MQTVGIPDSLRKSIRSQASKIVLTKLRSDYEKKANDLKKLLITEFINHPVTKEIQGGPTAQNITNTLNGYGNLFTFIGFPSSEDPISPILQKLNEVKISTFFSGEKMIIRVSMPTPDDIWEITPLPWMDGRSWAKGIESGISGLNYFLYLKSQSDDSRSGFGVQTHRIRSSFKYTPTQYISTLLKKYKTKFLSLGKKDSNISLDIINIE